MPLLGGTHGMVTRVADVHPAGDLVAEADRLVGWVAVALNRCGRVAARSLGRAPHANSGE